MKTLINIADLKGTSIINDNVDEKYLIEAIETAQSLYLEEIIGSKLLNKLLDGITEEGVTLEADYYNLVIDYIQPFLKRRIAASLVLPLNYKVRNAGVVVNSAENYTVPTFKEAMSVQQHFEDEANAYALKLVKYLNCNSNKFPEYCCKKPNINTIIYLG